MVTTLGMGNFLQNPPRLPAQWAGFRGGQFVSDQIPYTHSVWRADECWRAMFVSKHHGFFGWFCSIPFLKHWRGLFLFNCCSLFDHFSYVLVL